MSDLTKKEPANAGVSKPIKIALPRIAVAAAKAEQLAAERAALDAQRSELAARAAQRLVLILDDSGSMSGYVRSEATGISKTKIDFLHDACEGFINSFDFSEAALTIATLNRSEIPPLDNNKSALALLASQVDATDSTPIGETLKRVLENVALTRAVLISDGESTDTVEDDTLAAYKEMGVPCDCVHIGNDRQGEVTMQHIAEMTGGIFVKFKDVGSFARALKYLSPALRGLLMSASVEDAKRLLGSDEVRK